jgi:Zn-dependent protease with chaperone function
VARDGHHAAPRRHREPGCASARKLFVDFQRTSLQQPNPPTWDYLWLETHPTIAQRIAMVEAWVKQSR